MDMKHDTLLQLPTELRQRSLARPKSAGMPDLNRLTPDQRTVFDTLVSDCLGGDQNTYLVEGYAGTGKTFTISAFIEYVLATTQTPVVVTAPTHKAVKVLKDSAAYWSDRLSYSTTHSMLGMRELIDGFGNQKFIKSKDGATSVPAAGIVVVDEASMLDRNMLVDVLSACAAVNTRIVFMGDPCQIPPVGEGESEVFKDTTRKTLGIRRLSLTQVMRQAEDSPVLSLANAVRENIRRPIRFQSEDDLLDNGDGVIYLDGQHRELFYKALRTYFASPNFEADAGFVKLIAWRNKTVDMFNELIRRMIFNRKDLPYLLVGEKLVAAAPIFNEDGRVVLGTNEELLVEDLSTGHTYIDTVQIKFYSVGVSYYQNNEKCHRVINVLHEDSKDQFEELAGLRKADALAEQQGTPQAATLWRAYYRFIEQFSRVAYNYAITAHKAQGSTYDNVFMMLSDIEGNRKVYERNRIIYTTMSRPRHKLIILS